MTQKDEFQVLFDQILGQHFLKRRLSLGLSQEDMAKRMDVLRQQYAKLEYGTTTPTLYTLYKLLKASDQDVCTFLKPIIDEFEVETTQLRAVADREAGSKYFKEIRKRKAEKSED